MLTFIKKNLQNWRKVLSASARSVGVCFHAVHAESSEPLLPYMHSVSFKQFRQLIKNITRVASVLPADEFVEEVYKSKARITTISFDDAYASIFDQALPYLIERQMPLTVFVNPSTLKGNVLWRDNIRLIYKYGLENEAKVYLKNELSVIMNNLYKDSKSPLINSGLIDEKIRMFCKKKKIEMPSGLYLSVTALKELSDYKEISIGNHSASHFMLSSLTSQQQEEEIIHAQEYLTNAGITPCKVFAAPFGGYKTVNEVTFSLLKQAGYIGMLLTNGLEKVNYRRLPSVSGLRVANRFLP